MFSSKILQYPFRLIFPGDLKDKCKYMSRHLLFIILLSSLNIMNGQNLIPNYGFEEGFNVGHDLRAYNGSEVFFSGTGVEMIQGDSALKIDIRTIGTGGPQVIGIRHYLNGLEVSKSYLSSVFIKGNVGQEFRIRVHGDQRQVQNFSITNEHWNAYEFLIESLGPSSDGEYIVAVEFAFTGNSAGIWYVDSLVFTPVSDDPFGSLPRAFVAATGNDLNDGSINAPFKTIEKAAQMLEGDTIYLLEGIYHQENRLESFSGTSESPKVISPYPGHKVVFDGTIPIESSWEQYDGKIYKTKLDAPIWQLFEDGRMLNLCRWPNVEGFIEDKQPVSPDVIPLSLWDQQGTWGHSADNSTNGVMIDDGKMGLGQSGMDMTGAIAVLNIGSFKTSAAPVTVHSPGESHFEYDTLYTDPYLTWQKPDHAFYYLEGKLNLLDREGEWFFDADSGELYLMTRTGANPETVEIRGKNQSYALSMVNCDYLEIKNIEFTATTIKGLDCANLTIENCTFNYPSYSKRVLGEYGEIDITQFTGSTDHLTFRNNIVQYTEGEALHLEGAESIIENNLMRHIDFSCVNLRMIGGTVNFKNENNLFRLNTIYIAGASETVTPGSYNTVEENDIWGIGHLQNDGSIIQYMVSPTIGSITRNNWLHDCKKMGMRYDGSLDTGNTGIEGYWEPWENQTKGQVYGNVIWNCPTGLMIKGDYHVIVNNTVFDNEKVSIVMMNPPPAGANHYSICRNNVADMISGYRGGSDPDEYPLPGDHSHNWNGFYSQEYVEHLLHDIQNRDFRPSDSILIDKGSFDIESDDLKPELTYIDSVFDIGAYESGDTVYIIPGRREEKCSAPIPADGGISNTHQLMLAWRPAYKAELFHVYTGDDYDSVKEATPDSPEFKSYQLINMYLPDPLIKDSVLFWRIDAVINDSISKGNVWSFTAGQNANGAVLDTTSDVRFIVTDGASVIAGAGITIGERTEMTDDEGQALFTGLTKKTNYAYLIEKQGYNDAQGSIFLEQDTIIYATMELETAMNQEAASGSLLLYPNPCSTEINIANLPQTSRIDIINLHGTLIDSFVSGHSPENILVSHLPDGCYFIHIQTINKKDLWKLFLISR